MVLATFDATGLFDFRDIFDKSVEDYVSLITSAGAFGPADLLQSLLHSIYQVPGSLEVWWMSLPRLVMPS